MVVQQENEIHQKSWPVFDPGREGIEYIEEILRPQREMIADERRHVVDEKMRVDDGVVPIGKTTEREEAIGDARCKGCRYEPVQALFHVEWPTTPDERGNERAR